MNLNNVVSSISQNFKGWLQKNTQEHETKRQQTLTNVADVANRFKSFVAPENISNQISKLQIQKQLQGFTPPQIDISQIQNKFNEVMGNKTMLAGPLGYAAGLTNSGALNTAADITYRPLTRVGFEAAQTLSGDKNTYTPKSALEQTLLGQGELRNWNDPNRTARKVAHGVGADWLGTPLVGLGVALDATVPGVDDAIRQGGKKVTGELVERLGKEQALGWLMKYQDVLNRAGVKEPMSAVQALDYVEKNIPQGLAKAGVVTNDIFDSFKHWVNSRRATDLVAVKAKLPFTELDTKGVQGFLDFQGGEKTGMFDALKNYFDTAYERAVNSGLKVNYKNEYLPQLWSNPDEAARVFKTLGKKPSFTFESVIKDYAQGLEAGLSPRFSKVSDLVGWYESKLSRSIADRKFFDLLDVNGWIMPRGKAPQDWVQITAEGFPTLKAKDGEINYMAPEKLADAINNYLIQPDNALSKFANFVTKAKNIGLSAGVPGTAINAHGINLWARSWVAAKNPISQILKSTEWLVNPNAADKFVKQHLDEATKYVRAGMTVTVEDTAYEVAREELKGNLVQKGVTKLGQLFDDVFSKPLFSKMVPALKINYAQQVYNDVVKELGEVEARKLAATTANNVFGGINLDQLMRSKETQNFARSLILAPDWTETQFRIGKGIFDGLRDLKSAEGKAYRIIARNVFGYYLTANIINKVASGHWMFENDGTSNKAFIDTGTVNDRGEKRYLRPAGTSVDFVRLPIEIAMGMLSGDMGSAGRAVANRLSLPVSSIMHLLGNKNYLNQQLYGMKYGEPMPLGQQVGGIASEVANGLGVPSQVTSLVDFGTGKSSLEETAARLTEIPVRYGDKATSKKEIENRESLMAIGVRGQELHDVLNKDEQQTNGILNWISGLFNQQSKDNGRSTNPLLAALDEEAQTDKQTKRIKEIFSLGLDESNTRKMLENEKLGSYENASMVMIQGRGIENGERGNVLKTMLRGLTGDDFIKTILVLDDKGVLTSGVISKWVDDGDITESQAAIIKKIMKGPSSGGSSKLKSPGAVPSFKIGSSIEPIKINAPRLSQYKGSQQSSIKYPTFSAKLEAPKISRPRIQVSSMPQTIGGLGR